MMKVDRRLTIAASVAALTCLLGGTSVAATGPSPSNAKLQGPAVARARAEAAKARIFADKTRPDRTLNPLLSHMKERMDTVARQPPSAAKPTASRIMNRLMRVTDGYVAVDVVATGDPTAVRAELEAKGMKGISTFGKVISGRLPVAALTDAASTPGIVSIRPSMASRNAGLTTSQGDVAMRSDEARDLLKVAGRKVRVGVISDSFNCLAGSLLDRIPYKTAQDDVASGDLMRDIVVLKDYVDDTGACYPGATDEGRAMMQIVRDVAPRASGAFYTGFDGTADFANGIVQLATTANADVIVDDVIYFAEPMFQDGIIAQAVDFANRRGVAYFSSAGNNARQSWEGRFRNSRKPGNFGVENSFGPGNDTRQTMRISDGAFEILSFQWDQPYLSAGPVGTQSDLDIYFYDSEGNLLPDCDIPDSNVEFPALCQYWGASDNILGGDPVELAAVFNGTGQSVDVQIGIELYAGPTPGLMKYVWYDSGAGLVESLEYATDSPAGYGHNNARGAEAVGAVAWYRTTQWGNPLGDADKCSPACLEYFSSAGGTPILFDDNGRRLRRPETRLKPGVSGPDRGNTTFFYADFSFSVLMEPDGYPNFAGTSASAPHVAAVAALMLEASDEWPSPDMVRAILRGTARDMLYRRNIQGLYDWTGRGFDFDTGFGFVDAYRAVCTAAKFDDRRTRCRRDH